MTFTWTLHGQFGGHSKDSLGAIRSVSSDNGFLNTLARLSFDGSREARAKILKPLKSKFTNPSKVIG